MSRVISAGFVIFLLISSFAVMMVEPLTGSGAEDECSTSSAAPMGSRGSSRGVHPIIRINSNIEFNNQASLEVWDGLGLEGNPYIIENYVIDAQGAGNCIYIGNITLGPYFIIRNCTVTNASLSSSGYDSAGITLFNCQYGVVEDCIATDNMIGIYLNGSNRNTISHNNCSNNNESGIYLKNSDENIIDNNTCNENDYNGIFVNVCRFNIFENNTCNYNAYNGIKFYFNVQKSDIKFNTCNSNYMIGIRIENNCKDNLLDNNICNLNDVFGIFIYHYSSDNIIGNNTCNLNNESGIVVYQSDNSLVQFNECNNNSNGSGIVIQLSDLCTAKNNTCMFNNNSIYLLESDTNFIENNTCTNNTDGIVIETSDNNLVANNLITHNTGNGTRLIIAASYNYIKYNNISNNQNGVNITGTGLSSDLNFISFNDISYNQDHGIFIDKGKSNKIFHNLILFNSNQAKDTKTNSWTKDGQGNYWSDYTGLDNGFGGRVAGDGIGDTEIPHPGVGYDNYPFTDRWGWETVPVPHLFDPGLFTSTGNYTVAWNTTPRAMVYILEEDTNWTFDSPTEVYNGSELSKDFAWKENATYYYRLKAFNQYMVSAWSDRVEIIVDWKPRSPAGLTAQAMKGHSIKLSWDAHPDTDIEDYEISINVTDSSNMFINPVSISASTTQYIYSNLVEETKYYFVINALDKYSSSQWSNIASNTTLDETDPTSPMNLNATAISDTDISLTWNASPEMDVTGYHIYMNVTGSGAAGSFNLSHTMYETDTSYSVTGLSEQITYYFKIKAFDEVPNNSSFSTVASATTIDITPPNAPTGLAVSDPTGNSLTISWEANTDHDLVGYILNWSLSLTGTFESLNTEPITETQFIHTGLDEDTTYYYQVVAVDDFNLTSLFSDSAFGITLFGPREPEINHTLDDLSIPEDAYDDHSIDLNDLFKDVNSDPLTFSCQGKVHIDVVIYSLNGTVVLKPEPNWNGNEMLTFYANDGIFDSEPITINITVTPLNDPPEDVEIKIPENDLKITEGETISFAGVGDDPDLIYGDTLSFTWSSSIDGNLGSGEKLENITLTKGQHMITLDVKDADGENISVFINIIVQKKTDSSDAKESSSLIFIIAGIIIVVVVLAVVFAMFLRKKKTKDAEIETKDASEEEETPMEPMPTPQDGAQADGVQVQPQTGPPQPPQQYMPEQMQMQMYPQQQQQQLQQQPQGLPPTSPTIEQSGMEQPEPPEQEQMIPQQETPQLQIPIPDDAPPLPPTQEPLDMEGVEEPQSETEPIITSPEITTEVDTLDQTPDLEKPEGSESETEAKAEEPSSDE